MGLILGFVLAARLDGDLYTEDAFQKGRKLLKHFSKTSPLSKKFYDILSSLSEAITMRRDQITAERTDLDLGVQRLLQFGPSSVEPDFDTENTIAPLQDLETQFNGEEWDFFADQLNTFLPFPSDSFGSFLDQF